MPYDSLNMTRFHHSTIVTTENGRPKFIYVIGGKTNENLNAKTIEWIDLTSFKPGQVKNFRFS
jgi:hypothetical protein